MNDVITIDGPAGSGKSTVSLLLARKIKYLYLDTGSMYRAVALAANRKGINPNDGAKLGELCRSLALQFKTDEVPPRLFLDRRDISIAIRSPEIDMLSSKVSAIREVREAMTDLQRKIAKGEKVVAEGRDMGTVVFSAAKHKFFLTASLRVRARRRYSERLGQGASVSRATVEAELRERDYQDTTRSLSPLRPAKDAEVIDSSTLAPEEVVDKIISHIYKKNVRNLLWSLQKRPPRA